MLDFLNSVFLPSRKAGLLRRFLHRNESNLKVKRGMMKLESIPLLQLQTQDIIFSSCCDEDDHGGNGMRRVKILMGKEAAARLLSNCRDGDGDGDGDGGVLDFKNLHPTKPTALSFKTKYD
ncbi:hypothetical protein Salat_0710800 [Sesamum alatum]|uniref:DUF7890 domain-containing protein n=1 Tax=Sesamum alatum TaxID=300844 RepID=A0AAE1YSJ5_9LAMI|nr:hypothetical protein Salat_0710800 [Sesamum alatum]